MTHLATWIPIICLLLPTASQAGPPAAAGIRRSDPRVIVENYVESIYLYCRKYDATHRFHIENQLLADPNIRIGNDIDGFVDRNIQANIYFVDLKKQRVMVEYRSDFDIVTCAVSGKSYTLCLLHKKLHYRNGLKDEFLELVDLVDLGSGNWRIRTIVSSLFYNLSDFYCGVIPGSDGPDLQGCEVLALAEREAGLEHFAAALSLYGEALTCATDTAYVRRKLIEMKTLADLPTRLAEADQAYRQGDYTTSLDIYRTVAAYGADQLSPIQADSVRTRIISCTGRLQGRQLLADADDLVLAHAYAKALPLYREARTLLPPDDDLSRKLADCERLANEATEEKVRDTIAAAVRLITMGAVTEGFDILLRHRETGLLGIQELFYMAQILDAQPRPIKRKFDLSNVDCCILARQFMIEAKNKGAFSQDFLYLWEAHFNQRSRTCIR
ncbi:MAG: hypothetical protein RLY31_4 [Bacteroidota bacterium]